MSESKGGASMNVSDWIALATLVVFVGQLAILILGYFKIVKSANDYTNEFRTLVTTEKAKSDKMQGHFQRVQAAFVAMAVILLIALQVMRRIGKHD
jgi:predicted permease